MTPRQFEINFDKARKHIVELKDQEFELTTKERQYYLNEAIHAIINRKLRSSKTVTSEGIKINQKELDEIRNLIVKQTVLTLDAGLSTNTIKVFSLPDDYFFLISDYSDTEYFGKSKTYRNRLYDAENVYDFINDYHYKSSYRSPVSELANDKLYVHTDNTFTLSSVRIDYLKKYTLIDLINNENTNLSEDLHNDIVTIAVQIYHSGLNQNRSSADAEKNLFFKNVN